MDDQVILSDFFISDLQEIVDYLNGKAGAEIALQIGNEIVDRTLELGGNPFKVKRRRGARKVLRYPYRINSDVDEKRKIIKVLRVWHGARDPKTLRLV